MREKTPALVWPNGQPMRPDLLKTEIAAPMMGSVRSIISGHPAQGLTPAKLGSLLRAAEQGDSEAYFEMAEEMEEKDLHYLSVMGTRKRAVSQLDISVEEAGDSPEEKGDAELIRDWINRDTLESELFDILDAVGKGISATEIIWEFTSSTWLPADLKWVDPRFFEFDRETGQRLLLRGGVGTGHNSAGGLEELPAAKFIYHRHPAKSGLPIRSGIARAAAWGYMFKNYAIKDWVAFLEGYGHPLRVGKYGPNETETNKGILMQALQQLGTDAAAAFPETMSVEFIDRKAGTAPNDLWRSHAEYIDAQLSKAVLGQTNTTDAQAGGMGSGQANVHNDVRGDIERADAKLLAATLNRDLIRPIIMLNRGMRERYPRLKIGRPDVVDVAAQIAAASQLTSMGVRIGGEQMRERAGLPAPEDGEEALLTPSGGNAPQAPQEAVERVAGAMGGKKTSPDLSGPLKTGNGANPDAPATAAQQDSQQRADGIDLAVDEALADWESLITPILSPVEAMMDSAITLEEVRDRLAGELQNMDVTAFASVLAQAGFGAWLQGHADVVNEQQDAS